MLQYDDQIILSVNLKCTPSNLVIRVGAVVGELAHLPPTTPTTAGKKLIGGVLGRLGLVLV
jgi:hypothetical protein